MVGEEVARRSGANNRGTDLEDGLLPKLPDPVFGEEFHGCRDLPLIDGAEERVDLGRSNLEVASITGIESRLRFDYLAASRRDDWGLQTAGQTARLIAPTGRLFVRRRRLRLCSRRNQTSDAPERSPVASMGGRTTSGGLVRAGSSASASPTSTSTTCIASILRRPLI